MTPYPLGRHAQFDARSIYFPIKDILTDAQINTYTSKVWTVSLELNQGQIPSCTGHGHAHLMSTEPVIDGNVTEEVALKIYYLAQTLDGMPAGHEGSTVLAAAKAVQQLWPTAYGSFNWCFGIADVLSTLSHIGPVVLGITWTDQMFYPDSKGIITPSGNMAGGHCLEAIGIDVPNQLVQLHNSWGRHFGVDGDCFISWKDLDYLLNQGGEALVPLDRYLINL